MRYIKAVLEIKISERVLFPECVPTGEEMEMARKGIDTEFFEQFKDSVPPGCEVKLESEIISIIDGKESVSIS